jgi:RNA polymerase sigma factor (sigma-70 family)
MSSLSGHLDVIKQAQLGNKESMSLLASLARGRVLVYIYRLTLDYDLSQDLTQETMLEMIRSMKKLTQADRFWPWLYRTALGKVQHHFRIQGPKRIENRTVIDTAKVMQHAPRDCQTGLTELARKESKQIILEAIGRVKFAYRNVLTLRCFEQMPYSEIALLLGCTQLQARLLFFRAKQSLRKQLSQRGFGKEHFLSALGLFGAITAVHTKSASAASTITAASVKVGAGTWTIGTFTTKSGVAVATATVLLGITAGTITVQHVSGMLAGRVEFDYPSHLVNAYDPDGDGWKGTGDDSGKEPLFSVSADALVGYRSDNEGAPLVIIPDGHFMELGFDGTITNGPGDDIKYIARNTGNYPRIYLTDGMGQIFELQTISSEQRPGLYHIVGYDISGVEPPFEPNSLRIEGNGSRGPWAGAALFNITARISQ